MHDDGSVRADLLEHVSDEELRGGIRQIFAVAQQLIDAGRAEVVILAARRLACLYKLLVASGAPALSGAIVISDRCVASAPADARSVLILDDAVLVGTTMDRLSEEIRHSCPQAGIIARALVEDPDQRAKYLLPNEDIDFQALYTRSATETERFAKDLVRLLAAAQVPFFADFPITRVSRWQNNSWESLLRIKKWYAADVTAPLFEDLQYSAFAQIPTETTWFDFLSKLPAPLSDIVDAIKLRSYVLKSGEEHADVVFVPIAMLAPATPRQLEDAFSALPIPVTTALKNQWARSDASSRHRLVQYLLSVAVFAEIAPEISKYGPAGESELASTFDPMSIQLSIGLDADEGAVLASEMFSVHTQTPGRSFPPTPRLRLNVPQGSRLLRQRDIRELMASTAELVQDLGLPSRPDAGESTTKIGLIFAHAVSSIFGFIDAKYERPQRTAIRQLESAEEYSEYIRRHGRVLQDGFTLDELRLNLLGRESEPDQWSRLLISLAIDEGNDLGIIVPVTQFDSIRNVAYRCYRLGETAFLAGSPLAYHAEPGWAPDEFTSSAHVGAEPLSKSAPFVSFREVLADRFEVLRAAVQKAIPGVPTEIYRGTVIDVGADYFRAFLVNLDDSRELTARFPRGLWSDHAPTKLAEDCTFRWTIFEDARGDTVSRTSRVRADAKLTLADDETTARAVNALKPKVTRGDRF